MCFRRLDWRIRKTANRRRRCRWRCCSPWLFKLYRGDPHEVFAEFDYAIGSASIAQVHRARLHDGTPVAVKVRQRALPKPSNGFAHPSHLAYLVELGFRHPPLSAGRG